MPNYKNRRSFDNGLNRGFASGNICVCPECGTRYEHVKGKPCREMLCAKCKVHLMNGNRFQEKQNNSHNSLNEENDSATNYVNKAFPFVVADKCISCGACIAVCPRKAIDFVENAAFINEEKCSNCKICFNVCPENAIILRN